MLKSLDNVETKPSSDEQRQEMPETKPPQDEPLLHVAGIGFGTHTLVFAAGRGRREIPKDAVRLELFHALTDGPDHAPLSQARYMRSFLKSPITIQFEEYLDKKTATYYARWANENGQVGPWSTAVSKTIAV